MKQSETTMVSSSDVQFYPKDRLGLGSAGAQQESPDHYSYGGEIPIILRGSMESLADQV